ncbi:CoA-binding protein [Methanosarcina sp. Mfa9]|uniref:CoA-binding protein n=1 Tax=Methanosarcina sp. Mfa9 TaxID=3439063 RepID=UPI003F863A22
MEAAKSERESYWDAKTFAFITDKTKPAMKWAISELKNRGKNVYVVDLSDSPEPGSLKSVSDLPVGIDHFVIGITKTEPADLIPALKGKGVKKIWFHWKTETEKALDACKSLDLECMTEHCPMLYLGGDISIHGVHRAIAKMTGKY